MRTRLHTIGRGRLIAAATVVITTGLLVGVARMVFSHPVEAANEPGIVMTGTPQTMSSQSSMSSSAPEDGGSDVTDLYAGADPSDGTAEEPEHSEDGLPVSHDQAPQAVDPDPPVAVDNGSRQAAPAGTADPGVTEQRTGDGDLDDNDNDNKTPQAAVGGETGDSDKDGDGDGDND